MSRRPKKTLALLGMLALLVLFMQGTGFVIWLVMAAAVVAFHFKDQRRDQRLVASVEAGNAPPVIARQYVFDRDFEDDAAKMQALGYRIRSEGMNQHGRRYVTYIHQ